MAIEFALDGYGNRVTSLTAITGKDYICPYCKEIMRLNSRGNGFLWHKPMSERQRPCPWYTGKSEEIDTLTNKFSDLEIFYNGGVPLYLCNVAYKKYELYAIFPSLSETSYNKLVEDNIYVLVSDGITTNRYSVEDKIRFKVCNKENGLTVKIENKKDIPKEIRKKWLIGMRGLSLREDIFCSTLEGGYRVALNSNIILNKEYILIGEVPRIQGISFEYKGEIYLGYIDQEIYPIYSMIISEYTNDSKCFIEGKGYHLIKESDEIIAIWPPAHFDGNELICNEKEEYFFHVKRGDQDIFNWDYTGLYHMIEANNLVKVPTVARMVLITDYYNRNVKEIRYRLNYTRNRNNKNPKVSIKALASGKEIQLPENIDLLPNNSQIIIIADIKFNVMILNGLHVEQSARELLQPIPTGRTIILDCKGLGLWSKVECADEIAITAEKDSFEVDAVMIVKFFMNLSTPYVVPWSGYGNLVKRVRNRSLAIAKIMKYWGIEGKIPVRALPIIKYMEDKIENE